MKKYLRLIIGVLLLVVLFLFDYLFRVLKLTDFESRFDLNTIEKCLFIAIVSWILIELLRLAKNRLLRRYDISSSEDNLESRKLHTQINLIEKVIVALIILTAIGLILISIESIREIGIAIFASAGVIGIIIGISAQKIVGALLAGIQIAITQPFRVDDAVVVEGEWGWIEEINLTYVVVRIWDKRRLVLPTTYFLEKPFQNWTRTTADLVGVVYIHTDYNVSFEALRSELTRLLEDCEYWDKQVNVLQVTDSKANALELRLLVSARNSTNVWNLRVYIREKMIEYIQKNYPGSLPRTRIVLENKHPEDQVPDIQDQG